MHRNTNRPCLICNGSCDCLTDPPSCIGTEFVTFSVIEFLHRFDQTEISLLNQIQKQHAASNITFRNADYQTQVCFCQTLLGILIAFFHSFCKLYFLIRSQEIYFTNLFEVHSHRILNADTFRNRQINGLQIHIAIRIQFQIFIPV